TFAQLMPSSLDLARTSLLSIPSFFAMSYIRTRISRFYRPAIPQSLHALNMLTLERPSTYLLGNRCFANFWIAPGRFRADGLNNSGSLLPDFREFGQIARFRLQQGLQTQKPAVYQHI